VADPAPTTPTRPAEVTRGRRFLRSVVLIATGVLLVVGTVWAFQLWSLISSHEGGVGVDFHRYEELTGRWLASGQFYLEHQLAGPTTVTDGDPLYPPIVLYLLLPFQLLPEVLWWVIPLSVLAYVLVRLRPRAWTWPLLAAVVAWPRTPALIIYGNPGMWIDAAIGAGVLYAWPAALVFIKPSLLPLALLGIRKRSWWIAVGLLTLAALPFGTLWLDYLTVLRNSAVPATYSVLDLPLALAPVIAWMGRSDRSVGIQMPWSDISRRLGWRPAPGARPRADTAGSWR
jgi:hypothetical protein